MKKRVLLHADSLIRDPAYLLVVAELLSRRGVTAIVSSRITTAFYLRTFKPHVLVHSQAHAVRGYYDQGVIDERRGPLVVFVPQEGNNANERTLAHGFRGILDNAAARFIHRVYHFNDWHVDWFKARSAFSDEQLVHAGNPRLDIVKYGGWREPKPATGVIGFVGRFPTVNKYDGTSFLSRVLSDTSERPTEWHDQMLGQIGRQIGALHWYGQFIHRLMKETDLKVSLRPHHEEDARNSGYLGLKQRYGDRVEIDHSMSIFHWARSMDAVVSSTSLTSMETHRAGTPFLCIDPLVQAEDTIRKDADEALLFDCFERELMPRDPDHFMDLIAGIRAGRITVGPNPRLDAYLQDHFSWPYEGSVLRRLTDGIQDALEAAPGRGPALPFAESIGNAYYLLSAVRGDMRRPRRVIGKNYAPWFHETPPFVASIADRVLLEADRDPTSPNGSSPPQDDLSRNREPGLVS